LSTPHRLTIRVYYEDTDFSGLVYHASYLRFMERARTELLRDLGLNQGALSANADAILFVVRAMTVDFHRPATMDDLLVVETDVVAVGAATLALEQRILRDSARLIAAKVTIAAVDNGRARRLPTQIRAKFQHIVRAQET
jgi:acyl-CoA thioester hydrolase